ncbi:MAG: RNA polymerase sigma factor [Acetivibrio sp.]
MTEQDNQDYEMFLDGDKKGFENLVLRYKAPLIYFIERYVRNMDAAEDLAQDVFVEILVHKNRYGKKSAFKTYLFSIGRNLAIDWIRKEKNMDFFGELSMVEERYMAEQRFNTAEFVNLEEQVIKKEELRSLSYEVDQLKEEYREVILLVDFEEMTYKEAAKVLKKTLPQVKILLYRARKSLKTHLERSGYEK